MTLNKNKNIALIVAAGIGARSGLDFPKQYFKYNHKTILEHTLNCFINHNDIDYIQVIIHQDHESLYEGVIQNITNRSKIRPVAFGGASRQESVLNGLNAIKHMDTHYVLIHDAARPFLNSDLITNLLEKLKICDGTAPALPVTDSLRYLEDSFFTESLSRDNLYSVQTPQAFHYKKILKAHLNTSPDHTDDISVGIEYGLKTTLTKGCRKNIKMTTAEDFKNMIHRHNDFPDIRVGTGYDVHRLIAGDHVILGGIKIPSTFTLKGHSDADVLLHAITDAVLGSASENDIGYHFPPSDNQWENKDSSHFLKYAIELLEKKNGFINHIDCTLICERPKVQPYRTLIRENIAKICALPLERVNIKATTTETLGFTGRKEGIAAEATVTSLFSKAN